MEILVVLVLYKCPLSGSASIASLASAFRAQPALLRNCHILVWDNSPSPQEITEPPFPFDYRHAGANLGVSGAYNQALKAAEAANCAWMLLLDQDTTIPPDFLPAMLEAAQAG